MHWLDYSIIAVYFVAFIGVGVFFMMRQSSVDEYFVGDRKMGAGHIGFSVVATDVGGGFSIGLGGLGFTMGLSGSWLLFTGLVGAWLAAVLVIPTVKRLGDRHRFLTYPDFLEVRFDSRIRLVAAVVSGVGYAGFVGAQILAGAKLSAAAFDIDQTHAALVMAAVVIVYTSLGGIQAVIYTDTAQWIILLCGLLFLALPFAYHEVGGLSALRSELPAEYFSLGNVTLMQLLTWGLSIVPIWFVGMTLYQRIYATRDERTAKRAWFLAGLLEWPLMAFLGVILGMFARVLFPEAEAEMGLPLLIKNVLPVAVTGLVIAAYFSAILSTADSCLLASAGNFVNDLYQKHIDPTADDRRVLRVSRIATLVLGTTSIAVALTIPRVLDAILLSYAFMVSGLFVPTIAGLHWKRASPLAALCSMALGGGSAILFSVAPHLNPVDEPILVSLPISLATLVVVSLLRPETRDLSFMTTEEPQ